MKRIDLVNKAFSYLGVVEGSTTHKKIIDTYNKYKNKNRAYNVSYKDAWCATFVSSLFIELGSPEAIPIECSCFYMSNLAKERGMFKDRFFTPKMGDIILFDWEKNGKIPDHVGIVKECDGVNIITIEGNKNDAVGNRKIAVGSKSIYGYIIPRYTETTESDNETIAKQVIAGLWGNGDQRKKNLELSGYDYKKIQAIVNQMMKSGVK